MLQGIRVIRGAASTDGGKWLVDTPLLKLIHPFDHRCLCLALRPDVIEHWATDLSGPVQYIDQTCYLLPSNLIKHRHQFPLGTSFRNWSILDSSSPNFGWRRGTKTANKKLELGKKCMNVFAQNVQQLVNTTFHVTQCAEKNLTTTV